MNVRLLDRSFNRADFCCGVEALDRYLQNQASQDVKSKVCACYVLLATEDATDLAGYYTFSATSLQLCGVPEEVKKRLPRYPLMPAILIGRLAISEEHKGKGLGAALLVDALKRAERMSAHIGAWAVVVDAKDESAASFYEKHGFLPFLGNPLRLFIPVKTIGQLQI